MDPISWIIIGIVVSSALIVSAYNNFVKWENFRKSVMKNLSEIRKNTEIFKIKILLDDGSITRAEYDQLKKELIFGEEKNR